MTIERIYQIMQRLLVTDAAIEKEFAARNQTFTTARADDFRRAMGMRHDLDQARRLLANKPRSTAELLQWVEAFRELTGNAVHDSPFFRLRLKLFRLADERLT